MIEIYRMLNGKQCNGEKNIAQSQGGNSGLVMEETSRLAVEENSSSIWKNNLTCLKYMFSNFIYI